MVFNLTIPFQVFFHSLAALSILLLTHYLYRKMIANQNRNQHSFLYRLQLFQPPSEAQIWLIGFVGIATSYYIFFINPSIYREFTGTAGNKLLESLIPFSYAPFFIPLGKLYGSSKMPSKQLWIKLALYTILLFIISIGRNSRGAFMIGFTSIAFAYFLGLITEIFKSNIFTQKNAVIAIVAILVITGPIADLGTAMVTVRNDRNDVKASELIGLTMVAFQDKKALKMKRLEDRQHEGEWDEKYLDNIFTARFSNLKFNDASLLLSAKVGENNPAMRDYTINHSLAAFPQPFLEALNIHIDKNSIVSLSFGDYIYSLAGAGDYAFGTFRTGHFAGTGMASFGWWYLLILAAGLIPVYFLVDKLVFVKQPDSEQKHIRLRFSFCGLLALTTIFQFLPSESVSTIVNFLFRGWIQMVLLYFILFHITRVLVKMGTLKR